MLPPHRIVATFLPRNRSGSCEHRGEARRACPFDHGLLDSDEHRDRALEVALGDEHDVVRIVLEDARGELARLLDRDAFGERVAAQAAYGSPGSRISSRDRARPRLRSARCPASAPGWRSRSPDIRPPPPIGTTITSRSGASSSISSADGPRPGDDLRIVERMDEDVALLERELARLGVGVVEHVAVEHDLGAVPGGLRHFHRRRVRGMTIVAGMPSRLRVIGDRLRVVAGRGGDHAALSLLGRQLQQFVERAALLVGGGELEVLELQPDFGADDFGQASC